MKETLFKNGFQYIWHGLCLVVKSIAFVIWQHKAITALVVSLLINIFLSLGLIQARAERDHNDKRAYQMEQKVDSLTIIAEGKQYGMD